MVSYRHGQLNRPILAMLTNVNLTGTRSPKGMHHSGNLTILSHDFYRKVCCSKNSLQYTTLPQVKSIAAFQLYFHCVHSAQSPSLSLSPSRGLRKAPGKLPDTNLSKCEQLLSYRAGKLTYQSGYQIQKSNANVAVAANFAAS